MRKELKYLIVILVMCLFGLYAYKVATYNLREKRIEELRASKHQSPSIYFNWSKKIEDNMKASLMIRLKPIELSVRRYICNCYIEELKEEFPNGVIGGVPDSVAKSSVDKCIAKALVLKKSNGI